MKLSVLRVLAIGATVGGFALAINTEKAEAAEWTPRSVEAIKADIAKSQNNKYTIVWGDTMWGISQATNLTVQKLASLNNITNVDLIFAGNTLVFDGNVVSVENAKGETVAQSVVRQEDKVDATKPVGQQVQNTTNSGSTSSTNNSGVNTNQSSKPNTPESNNNNGESTDENIGEQTTPSTPESNGGSNTPSQPNQPENGGNGGTTTPEQPNNPGGGDQGGNGGTTTPEEPSQPDNGGGNGNQGGTTNPSQFYVGQILYSKSFGTTGEAEAHMYEIMDEWYTYADNNNISIDINAEGSGPYTVYVKVVSVN